MNKEENSKIFKYLSKLNFLFKSGLVAIEYPVRKTAKVKWVRGKKVYDDPEFVKYVVDGKILLEFVDI